MIQSTVGWPRRMYHSAMMLLERMVLLAGLLAGLTSGSVHNTTRSGLLKELFHEYNYNISPNYDKETPLVVKIGIQVAALSKIDEMAMQYSVTLFLKQWWIDPRLRFEKRQDVSYLTLDPRMQSSVWFPDLHFSNEKSANMHDTMLPNSMMRLYPSGTVFNSVRLSLVLDCPMDLHRFPMDTQVCSIDIGTISSDSRSLVLEWKNAQPIDVSPRLHISDFLLVNYTVSEHFMRYVDVDGEFSSMHVHFLVRRDIRYYLMQTYLPFALIVILSWVSFWIDPKSPPARVGLGITTVLTLTTEGAALERRLPNVSYIKAIDIWSSFCSIMVFAALIEYAVVNVLQRWEADAQQGSAAPINQMVRPPNELDRSVGKNTSPEDISVEGTKDTSESSARTTSTRGNCPTAHKVDVVARIVFPLIFVVFNAAYWPTFVDMDDTIRIVDTRAIVQD